jgi:microcystin-dependent protein
MGSTFPTGSIIAYFGLTPPSQDWLLCDGQEFDPSEYYLLYYFLNTNKVPDLRGCFIRGSGTNSLYKSSIGIPVQGQELGSYAVDNVVKHNHQYSANRDKLELHIIPGYDVGLGPQNRFQYYELNGDEESRGDLSLTFPIQTLYTLRTYSAHSSVNETYPPSIAVNYIIKT